MKTEDLKNLMYNPLWTSQLIHYLLSGAKETPNGKLKFEILYIVLPMLYNHDIYKKLNAGSKRSTFNSVFADDILRRALIGINQQSVAYKEITNKALLVIGRNVTISEDGFIEVMQTLNYKKNKEPLRSYYKAAFNLGLVLSKEHYREIFLRIGVVA